MKSIFKKLLFVALGIALSALLLEAGLQLRAWHIRHSLHTQVKHTLSAKDKITILCIGESTTDNQWPRFLNQALLDAGITKEVRVIDRGVGGTTTGIILQNITYYIEKYNPDIIVAMMGINDTEDYIPFTRNTRLKTVK
ncbi:MAG: hypothetical protein FWC85_03755, partial [Elusimicrobia bacterium]|nr:hypothetical protein [Elusimicrobiota bacterium]